MASISLPDFQAKAEQIPFLLNGTLSASARAELQAAIAAEPALARELELQRKIREAVNQSAAVPHRSTLPQFLNRLAAESQREVNQSNASNVKGLQRSVTPLSSVVASQSRRGWKIAFAVAASLVQAAMLAPLLNQGSSTLEPLSGASTSANANLQIVFKPEATERQIRELLRANGVEIVAGPSALGVYQARATDAAKASAQLGAATTLIESASVSGK
jgi:anti-sigma factor RsiW